MRVALLTAAALLAVAPVMAQPMPPARPDIPQTMPPRQMPPEQIAPDSTPPDGIPSGTNHSLSQVPSGQRLTPGQSASPTRPAAPLPPDLQPTPGTNH